MLSHRFARTCAQTAAKMIKTVGGALRVVAMATHGVLSGKAFQLLFQTPNNCLNELVRARVFANVRVWRDVLVGDYKHIGR
jgi:hypothetical protein